MFFTLHFYLLYTEKNISKFFLFFIGILPQGVENTKICYLKGTIYYCESEITGQKMEVFTFFYRKVVIQILSEIVPYSKKIFTVTDSEEFR